MMKNPKLVIFLTVFIDLVGFGIIIPLNPYIASHFGADAFQVGLLMAIYSFFQFLMAPFWGSLSDRYGRRPIILVSLLGAAICHLMFAFGSELWMLFVARGLAGLFAANISTAFAYMADITDEADRSKSMGLIGAAFGLGFILGPFLGGVFGIWGEKLGSAPPLGQSFAAVAASAICFINFLLALKILKESLPENLRGKAKEESSRLSAAIGFIKRPVFGSVLFAYLTYSLAMAAMETTFFLFVKDEFGWGVQLASFGFAYVGLVMVFTQGYLVRKLLPKFGEPRVLVMGLVIFGLGLTGLGFSFNIVLLAIVTTLIALGQGLIMPSTTGSLSLLADKAEQGAALGVQHSLSALARILGPIFGGWLYHSFSNSAPFLAGGGLCVVALLILAPVYKKLPNKAKNQSGGGASKPVGAQAEIMYIGLFQLQNLRRNEVPFLLLDLRGASAPGIASPELDSIFSVAHSVETSSYMGVVSSHAVDKSFPVILVCGDGESSNRAALELVRQQYINVYVVEGGLRALEAEQSHS